MSLQRFDIAYFDFLHLDTANEKKQWTNKKNEVEYSYRVRGKRRRMLVLGRARLGSLSRNGQWLLILYITGVRPDRENEKHFVPIEPRTGRGLREDSYVRTSAIHTYPERLGAPKREGQIEDRMLQGMILSRARQLTGHAPHDPETPSVCPLPLVPGSPEYFEP